MPEKFGHRTGVVCDRTGVMCGNKLGTKLGEMSLHGDRRNYARAQNLF